MTRRSRAGLARGRGEGARRPAAVRHDQPALRPREPRDDVRDGPRLAAPDRPGARAADGLVRRATSPAGRATSAASSPPPAIARWGSISPTGCCGRQDGCAAGRGRHPAAAGPRRRAPTERPAGSRCATWSRCRSCSPSSPGSCDREAGSPCSRRAEPEGRLMRRRPPACTSAASCPRSAGCSRTERPTRTSRDRPRTSLLPTELLSMLRAAGFPDARRHALSRRHHAAPRGDPRMTGPRIGALETRADPLGDAFDLLAAYRPPAGRLLRATGPRRRPGSAGPRRPPSPDRSVRSLARRRGAPRVRSGGGPDVAPVAVGSIAFRRAAGHRPELMIPRRAVRRDARGGTWRIDASSGDGDRPGRPGRSIG